MRGKLRVILNDHENDFETLLWDVNMAFVTIIETFKHSWSKSSKLKKSFLRSWDLSLKGQIILKTLEIFQEFETERKRTVYFGLETTCYRSPQVWSFLPEKHETT